MTQLNTALKCCAAAAALFASAAAWAQSSSPLILTRPGGHAAHIFPTYTGAKEFGLIRQPKAAPLGGPVLYHGGPIMPGALQLYVIFWQPSHLQDGSVTTLDPGYKTVQTEMVGRYPGHGLAGNDTQYYQTNADSNRKTYVAGTGVLAARITDRQPYPVSACAESIGPNCFTDAQLQAEVQRVMTAQGWTGGLNKLFLVFTSKGEGSCFNNGVNDCSSETANVRPIFCAYHSYIDGEAPIVYTNEPFGNVSCLGDGVSEPNLEKAGAEADPAASTASHEISEAITDPLLNAWYARDSEEIADICGYNYGTNTWDHRRANQMWGGKFFELQTEYSNHAADCVQLGP